MLNSVQFIYFSPTGGTKKSGELFCNSIAETISYVDIGHTQQIPETNVPLVVIAMPVFGGRIPAFAAERLKTANGHGTKAVTLAVYGNREYEDALLEMNEIAKEVGYSVIASAAVIAQHSMLASVAAGRPDQQDAAAIANFAARVMEKFNSNSAAAVSVPGNIPHKPQMQMDITPITTQDCTLCGQCVSACPVAAIRIENNAVLTEAAPCMLCLACTAVCPVGARIVPSPLQERMTKMLSPLAEIRKENEYFL